MNEFVAGAAPAILLLHGCSGTVRSTFETTGWLAAIDALGRRPVAPDLPGHGHRRVSHEPVDYADLAGEVARSLPSGIVDIIGFSLGAKLALELALRFPQRVRRMVLGGVGDNVFAPEAIAASAAAALEDPASPAARHPAVRAMLEHWEPDLNDPLAVAAVLRRPPNPVFTTERLQRLVPKVLVVNGVEDPVGQKSDVLLACLPRSSQQRLEGVDHFNLPRQPEFRRLALEFLQVEIME